MSIGVANDLINLKCLFSQAIILLLHLLVTHHHHFKAESISFAQRSGLGCFPVASVHTPSG